MHATSRTAFEYGRTRSDVAVDSLTSRPKRSAPKGNERGHTLSSHPRAPTTTTSPSISQRPQTTLAYHPQAPTTWDSAARDRDLSGAKGPAGLLQSLVGGLRTLTLNASGRGVAQRRRDHHRLCRQRLRGALRPRPRDDVAALGDRQQTTSEWSVRRPRAIECTTGMLNERSTARSAYNRSPLTMASGL